MKQTVLAFSKLHLSLQKPMADVPNQVGFKLLGVLKSNSLAVPLHVDKDAVGCHVLLDQFNKYQPIGLFSGWLNEENN